MILLEIMTTEKATELKQTLLDANDQALRQTEPARLQAQSMKERLRASRLEAATLPSLVIAFQASQVFVAISIMALLEFLPFIFEPIIIQFFWTLIAAGVVYIVVIVIIFTLHERLRTSTACFLLLLLLMLSEGILLSALGYLVGMRYFMCVFGIMGAALYCTAGFAICLKKKYSAKFGRLIALLVLGIAFVLFGVFMENVQLIWMVSTT